MVLTFGIYARTDFYWDLRIFISLQLFINFGNCFILKLDLMPTNASLVFVSGLFRVPINESDSSVGKGEA